MPRSPGTARELGFAEDRKLKGGGLWVWTQIPGAEEWCCGALFLPKDGVLTLAELRVFPDAGQRIKWSGGRRHTVKVGTTTWTFGGIGVRAVPLDWSKAPRHIPDGEVTKDLLKRVPMSEITGAARRFHAGLREPPDRRPPKDWTRKLAPSPPNPGRRGRPPIFWATWAQQYIEELHTPNVNEVLAKKYGGSPVGVRDLIYKARRLGYLTPTAPGKPGGELTDKALEVLSQPNTTRKGRTP